MSKATKQEQAEALARLRAWLKPGDTVYTILRHVSRSGMSRTIDVIGIDPTEPERIHAYGWNVAKALGMTFDRDREGVKVSGGGMDMGFHLVYSMGAVMWPEGVECAGEKCQSNDHSNGVWMPVKAWYERVSELRQRIAAVERMSYNAYVAHETPTLVSTCGTCGMSWTIPTPSARCPFEYEHGDIAELQMLLRHSDDNGIPRTHSGRVRTDPRGPGVMHRDGGYALRQRWL